VERAKATLLRLVRRRVVGLGFCVCVASRLAQNDEGEGTAERQAQNDGLVRRRVVVGRGIMFRPACGSGAATPGSR